jgi:hypothetical protein
MMQYSVAHFKAHFTPEYFETKKPQIQSVLDKYKQAASSLNEANNRKKIKESITGEQMLTMFHNMHHDVGMNDKMDEWIRNQEWGVDTIKPNDIASWEQLFDYDDPFDRVIDVDESQVIKYTNAIRAGKKLEPVILGPQYSDGKYSIADGNHRALAYAELDMDIPVYRAMNTVNESFDTDANWKLEINTQPMKLFSAEIDNNIVDLFYRFVDDEVNISFNRNGSIRATGEGSANRIFGAVINHIQKFLAPLQPNRITFEVDSQKEDAYSRNRLYQRMVEKLAAQNGYDYNTQLQGRDIVFTLSNRDKQTTNEAINPHGDAEEHLELMMQGRKPASLIHQEEYERYFHPYVDRYQWNVVKFEKPMPTYQYVGYAISQQGDRARAERIAQLVKNTNLDDMDDEYHIELGRLLGYSEQDIRDYLVATGSITENSADGEKTQSVGDIPQEIYNLLKELTPDDVGSEDFGDYVLRFEGFTDWCQQDAMERCQLPDDHPLKLKYYEAVYDEVLDDWIHDQGSKPIDTGFAGHEDYPIQWAIFKKQQIEENFADGKVKGKSRPGRAKRAGVDCSKSVSALRKTAKNSSGEKQKMAHWCANMKSGKSKKK